MSTQIATILKDKKLEPQTAALIQEAFAPVYEKIAEWQELAKTLVVTDISQKAQMKMAKEARIAVGKVMTGVGKTKDDLKEESKRYNSAVQEVHNDLLARLEPIKAHLLEQEKFEEREEERRKKALAEERRDFVNRQVYREHVAINEDFENMSEEQFEQCCKDAEAQYNQEVEREAAEKKRQEEAEAENQRIRDENARLKALQDKKDARIKRFSGLGAYFDGCDFMYEGKESFESASKEVLDFDDENFEISVRCFAVRVKEIQDEDVELAAEEARLAEEANQKALAARTEARIKYLTELGYEEDFGESFDKRFGDKMYHVFMTFLEDSSDSDFYEHVGGIERTIKQLIADKELIEKSRLAEEERKAKSAPDKEKLEAFLQKIGFIMENEYPELESVNTNKRAFKILTDCAAGLKNLIESL